LDEIAVDRIKFGFTERPIGTLFEHSKREDTHSFIPKEEVIGRKDEKKAVIKLLLNSDMKEDVSIIPIVGIGGLGKTTLAQYVYNDEEVQTYFDLRLWACVSDPFDMKTIVVKLIESATKKRPESLEMDPLQSELQLKISGKLYLLVLDDVWNANPTRWSSLKNLLVGGLRGSKVLITTRIERVAKLTGTISPYRLGGLSESNSWNLFKKMAFKDGEEPKNPKLIEIGREIVQKCAQVPLAIRSIGSLLYFKNSEDDWLYFKNNELYKITQEDNDIFPILKLSYDHLPLHLKQCFAFCCLFPKDFEIEVQLLIQLWIAQGFIHSSARSSRLEDVGREYFMDLLWRSFFQDVEGNEYGDIETCKMHDLIHDLAQSIAGNKCTISDPLLKAHEMSMLFPTTASHKPINDTLISSFKCLRALNLSRSNIQEVPNSIGNLKRLRFLELSWNEDIKILPNSITKLHNLQTLRLDFCCGLKELPKDTRNLISLRHLALYECRSLTHMPHGLRNLTALQTLTLYSLGKKKSFFPKQNGGLGDFDGLDELRGQLHIKGLEHLRCSPVEAKAANLERKQHLRILKLEWDPYIEDGYDWDMAIANDEQLQQEWEPNVEAYYDWDKEIASDEQLLQNLQPHVNLKQLIITGYAGVRLSSWVSSSSNLVSIFIYSCKWCRHIPPLYLLPSLKILSLFDLSSLKYVSDDDDHVSSYSLETLKLEKLPRLRGWRMSEEMGEFVKLEHGQHYNLPLFPCLSSLHIIDCPMISKISIRNTRVRPLSPTSSSWGYGGT